MVLLQGWVKFTLITLYFKTCLCTKREWFVIGQD